MAPPKKLMNCNSFDLGVLFLNPAQKLNYNFYYKVSQVQKMHTLRSLWNKPARLTIMRKFSTLLALIRVLLAWLFLTKKIQICFCIHFFNVLILFFLLLWPNIVMFMIKTHTCKNLIPMGHVTKKIVTCPRVCQI